MPPVYAIISFFSYRYFREYTYYEFIEVGEWIHVLETIFADHVVLAYEVRLKYFFVFLGYSYTPSRLSRSAHSCMFGSMKHSIVHHWQTPSLLLVDFVASTAADHDATKAIARKEKKALPIPVRVSHLSTESCWILRITQLCCWRYRPSKVRFLFTLNVTFLWSSS